MSNCFNNTTVLGCFNDSINDPVSVVIHYIYDNLGSPSVHITDISGNIIPDANLSNTSVGACFPLEEPIVIDGIVQIEGITQVEVNGIVDVSLTGPGTECSNPIYTQECPIQQPQVVPGTRMIAGSDREAQPEFNGLASFFDVDSELGMDVVQSITISAWSSTPSVPGQAADQIIVTMPDGNRFVQQSGETRSWSAIGHPSATMNTRGMLIEATRMAYATISWTIIQ